MRGVEGTVTVYRLSLARSVCRCGCVVEGGTTRKFLLEVVELEVEPNLASARAGARD